MTLHRSRARLLRFAVSSLVAVQSAIAATAFSEFILTTPSLNGRSAMAQTTNLDVKNLYQQASQAVVLVQTDDGRGSGSLVTPDGLILTNAHVVDGYRSVQVTLKDGRKFKGTVVSRGSGNCLDLALVKIEANNLPTIAFAASNALQVGAPVLAIGNPLDTTYTLTQGLISNLSPQQGLILTNAVLNPGNSGGPLLDTQGRLIGVNTAKYRGSGLYLAIAVDQARAFVQAFKQGLSPSIGEVLIPANTPLAQRLALDGTIRDSKLQAEDHTTCMTGSRADLYTFEGEADQPVMIEMSSSELGSYLMLMAPNGDVLAVDRSEGRNDAARVLASLPQTGTYTVIANAAAADQAGKYRLQATIPLVVEKGKLTHTTPQLPNGAFYRSYVFSGKAQQEIVVALHHFDFDPYLTLVDSNGKVVAQGKSERRTTLSTTLPRDGAYTLIVTSAKPGDRGQYFLSVHAPKPTTNPNRVSQQR